MSSPADWRPDDIAAILRSCSEIARTYYHSPSPELKSDRSLVTLADRAIEDLLESHFDRPDMGSYIIGEERVGERAPEYIESAFSNVAYVVDPIDGTAPYAHRLPTWGISIGRMEEGRISDGAVYLPITDELFITDEDEVLYGQIEGPLAAITAETRVPKEHRIESGMIALSQGVTKGRGISMKNPVQALGCAVLPLCYLLLDRFIGYIGEVKLWDVAGALPMLERANFELRLLDGHRVTTSVDDATYRLGGNPERRWKLNHPLVCASSKELVDYMLGALR